MSAKASKDVPPGPSPRPSSCISDVNIASASADQTQHKANGGSSQCVPLRDVGLENTAPAASSEQSPPSRSSPIRLLWSLFPHVSLVLENTGSVARDHLANERTWLAYIRTSLSIAGTGVALVQLFTISESTGQAINLPGTGVSLRDFARPLGATTVSLALFILGIGVVRYFTIQTAMVQGQFPTARGTVIVITATLAALVAITFGILAALPS